MSYGYSHHSVHQSTPVIPPLPAEYLIQQEQARRSSFAPPTNAILSPRPQHLPSSIPAGQLESRASEIAADANAVFQGNSNRRTSQQYTNSLQHTASLPNIANLSLDQQQHQVPTQMGGHPRVASYSMAHGPAPQSYQDQRRVSSTSASMPIPITGQTYSSRNSQYQPPSRGSLPVPQVPQRPISANTASHTDQANQNSLSQSASPPSSSLNQSRHSKRPSDASGPKLAKHLPTSDDIAYLKDDAYQSNDPARRVRWAREVFRFLERNQAGSTISDPNWVGWVDEAVRVVISSANIMPPIPEALYLRADLAMSGTFPTIIPKDPKKAFRDFEAAANAEYAPAWYRIGREYETFNDLGRAKDAYERGFNLGDVTCTYRLGMAHLLGQLMIPSDVRRGLELLRTAAIIAEQVGDTETAAPLYVWAMILAGEFEAPGVPSDALPRDAVDAGRFMKKAAYLSHTTAQYKVGWAYEHAQLGFPFDPFMSVQYYSLASKEGDTEADLALSKWFLCGAENCFSANEDLAYTFANKAAVKSLASAEFAMGYYSELGIGTRKDLDVARQWYSKAATQGNEDAINRLKSLERTNASMSRAEHDAHAAALVRKRTQARIRSDQESRPAQRQSVQPAEHQRRQTMRRAEQAASAPRQSGYRPQQISSTRPGDSRTALPPTQKYNLSDTASQRPIIQADLPVKKGPQTFSEMGIKTTNLKKEECTIC